VGSAWFCLLVEKIASERKTADKKENAESDRYYVMNEMEKAKRYILVLEDNEGFAAVLSELLNQAIPSHKTLVARTIEEGQTLACQFGFDLFVLDVNLPDGSGLDFLCDIRTVQPDALAVIITAAPIPEYRSQAQALGAIQFYEKPFDFAQFTLQLRRVLPGLGTEGESGAFRGTLRHLQLADVIQLKCFSGGTTQLVIEGPTGDTGEICIQRGQIMHARVGERVGVEAFQEILGWQGGSFVEAEKLGMHHRTIEMEWQMLLMETARKLDEMGSRAQS